MDIWTVLGIFLFGAAVVLVFIEPFGTVICGVAAFAMSVTGMGLYHESRQFRGR